MRMTPKAWAWCGGGLVLLLALLLALSVLRGRPPAITEPGRLDGDATLRLLASDDFSRLSPEQKLAFADRLKALRPGGPAGQRPLPLSAAEQRRLQENAGEVMRLAAQKQINDYFVLSTAKDRAAFLDRVIDEMVSSMSAGGRSRRRSRRRAATPGPGGRHGPMGCRLRERDEAPDRVRLAGGAGA
jgi:hypothetical protein